MPTTYLPPLPPGVTAEAWPLRFRPADLAELVREVAGDPQVRATTLTTRCGWHYHVAEPGDRFVAIFEFLDHVGVVVMTGDREAVMRVLDDARPDWRGDDVIALAQLWEPG